VPRRYYDPPIATGYAFAMQTAGPTFESVLIPAPLPGGDKDFTVDFPGGSAPIVAGTAYYFTSLVPNGVSTFKIRDIDRAESLDPQNSAVFVTGLTFLGETDGSARFSMIPVVNPIACDADENDAIDSRDIALITAARNQRPSNIYDPRDANQSGLIDVADARLCATKCTRARCAIQ
jgi:hypothetical protein